MTRPARSVRAESILSSLPGALGLIAVASASLGSLAGEASPPTGAAPGFLVTLAVGILAGVLTARLQQHPIRQRMWIPVGWMTLAVAQFAALAGVSPVGVTLLIGVALGSGTAPVRSLRDPLELIAFWVVAGVGVAAGLYSFAVAGPGTGFQLDTGILCGTMSAVVLWVYRRPCFEALVESSIWPFYRVRAVGPGVEQFPITGPLLVIANHASYLDPIWVMKALPRELTPMMYRRYFEWPVVHWFMAHVIRVIPVDAAYRHEVPELDEAVARLDRGEALLIFPEGWVRRTEDVVVRRFGQGVRRVLRERPATPVAACWIEGGWGSLTSFRGGPPFRNKRLDLRRPIDIAVAPPVVLDAETLADQKLARARLREMCVDARRYLGLAPIEE